ncbi:hypothetical protein DYB37_003822 [Aphanomyces astaci]|uniref:Cytochrome b561 bacterial/Ni-hydrogenase domain-containing protein n=2 Tax=Aphanomyces astaci TaxID=112090 RepID=A0A3R7B6U3_APHAT|nr:hypothetical protein DYB37_003822 [Aphanomyces astaci]
MFRAVQSRLQKLPNRARMLSTAGPDGTAYARSTSVFHWVVAGVFGGVVGTVKLAQNTTDKVEKLRLMNLHKSLAMIAAVLVPARIGTRLLTRSPQALAGPKWEQLLGSASHLGLYGLMIGLPSSGIAMGYYSGFGIPFFGSRIPGAEKPDKSISGPAYSAHKTMGQALVYFVPLHVGAAFFHHFRGAQIFQRINPFKASKFMRSSTVPCLAKRAQRFASRHANESFVVLNGAGLELHLPMG